MRNGAGMRGHYAVCLPCPTINVMRACHAPCPGCTRRNYISRVVLETFFNQNPTRNKGQDFIEFFSGTTQDEDILKIMSLDDIPFSALIKVS